MPHAVRSRIGRPREDLPWKETELDPEFERYVMEFREKKEPLVREALERRPATCQLGELSSRADIAAYLSRMERESHAATAAKFASMTVSAMTLPTSVSGALSCRYDMATMESAMQKAIDAR